VTPPSLATWLQCLPPMLHRQIQTSISSYSKAPRGLFVLLRVGRIYTANSISPSLSLRQRSSRYTIRAGQNLPDKEFRLKSYLAYAKRTTPCLSFLHVAMQTGPYHYPVSWIFGMWSLRILISSWRGFWRFMVSVISAISIKPFKVKW
jgi:hypothetical protein